jgi:hypothetical protein
VAELDDGEVAQPDSTTAIDATNALEIKAEMRFDMESPKKKPPRF